MFGLSWAAQRGCWKLFHETPTVHPPADALWGALVAGATVAGATVAGATVAGALVTGDTLFMGACGRCDLPGGDAEQMFDSLAKLRALDPATMVYPGHDYGDTPTSTIAHEIRSNRFLRCATFEEFRALRERKRP